ncbi:hypothetical protein C8J56DRAFT_396420 [Mycena floridula]|nr:hypothetical protein C8J56DRAFT_396420 [Mycena floridula]
MSRPNLRSTTSAPTAPSIKINLPRSTRQHSQFSQNSHDDAYEVNSGVQTRNRNSSIGSSRHNTGDRRSTGDNASRRNSTTTPTSAIPASFFGIPSGPPLRRSTRHGSMSQASGSEYKSGSEYRDADDHEDGGGRRGRNGRRGGYDDDDDEEEEEERGRGTRGQRGGRGKTRQIQDDDDDDDVDADGSPDSESNKPIVVVSSRGRKVKMRSYVESSDDPDDLSIPVQPTRRSTRRRVQDDEEQEEEDLFAENVQVRTTRSRTRTRRIGSSDEETRRPRNNLDGFIASDSEDGKPMTRGRLRKASAPPPKTSAEIREERQKAAAAKRAERAKRRASKDENYVDGDDDESDGEHEGDVADDSMDLHIDLDEPPEEEEEEESKGYTLRERQKKINYYVPPPLEELARPPAKRAKGKKGKGLGWSASGAELGRWMGLDDEPNIATNNNNFAMPGPSHNRTASGGAAAYADDSDSDHHRSPGKVPSGGSAMLGGVGQTELPTTTGKLGDTALSDSDPLNPSLSVTFDDIGGLDQHIHALKEMTVLPLLYPEVFAQFNVVPPRGVLFHGPPGTGKTMLARALAQSYSAPSSSRTSASASNTASNVPGSSTAVPGQSTAAAGTAPAAPSNTGATNANGPAATANTNGPAANANANGPPGGRKIAFFMRKGADALSKWVGEAERQLRLLFEEAKRCQPSIIFFDEIDGLAPVRSAKQDQIHASIVSTLLALMDGMDGRGQVIVIGATNRPDSIDPALRRPGRFDREFYFPLPDLAARKRILGIMMRGWAGWGDDAGSQNKSKSIEAPPASKTIEGPTTEGEEALDLATRGDKALELITEGAQRAQKEKEKEEGEREKQRSVGDKRLQGLAEMTKGYGGADLRALCTEAALLAVQRRYPQIYKSQDRLVLKPESIRVGVKDFVGALGKLVPSSARTSTPALLPLPAHFQPLLGSFVEQVKGAVGRVMPVRKSKGTGGNGEEEEWESDSDEDFDDFNFTGKGKGKARDETDKEDREWEREMRGMALQSLLTNRPRILIHGPAGMGQKYVGAAALWGLDGNVEDGAQSGG